MDGSKRLAWLATVVFLDLNDCEVTLNDDEASRLVMDVSEGILDVDATADVLAGPSSM